MKLPATSVYLDADTESVWTPADIPGDCSIDALAQLHADFRLWMNNSFALADGDEAWRPDPVFSNDAVKRLLHLAFVASLYTDEQRGTVGSCYIPSQPLSADHIVFTPPVALSDGKALARLFQPLTHDTLS